MANRTDRVRLSRADIAYLLQMLTIAEALGSRSDRHFHIVLKLQQSAAKARARK